MKPEEIESLSFSIIDSEAGDHGFQPEQWKIVQRMIHTSADFEYIKSVKFHDQAISAGIDAIRNGCRIVTDTNMAKSGIRKGEISAFGGDVHCFISDKDVVKRAAAEGITRAVAAVDKACEMEEESIFVIGNAPTALLRLMELVKSKKVKPALIIGLPVGFVNAAESKDALMELDSPHISNKGRKGGSNIVASIVNALAIMAAKKR
ncbi:MAG: precorrin-8X methylmutase [Thermodesulfobacteriota bacterium]|nr:precorrin-8X methylmutase [Thermodesulfobacteriota bacterium]